MKKKKEIKSEKTHGSWTLVIVLLIIEVLLAVGSLLLHSYNVNSIYVYLFLIIINFVVFISLIYCSKNKSSSGNKDDKIAKEEIQEIRKLMVSFYLIFFVSLVVFIFMAAIDRLNLDVLYIYLCGIVLLLEFILLPNKIINKNKKNITYRIFEFVVYISIGIVAFVLLFNLFLKLYGG